MGKVADSQKWKHWRVVLASAAILLGAFAIVVSISNLMQGPTADEPPNKAEWLSAVSTFWGAVATALGAVLTGGALLIAALTYQRQVRDRHAELEDKRREDEKKHREQAEAVTVKIGKFVPAVRNFGQDPNERRHLTVRNDGKLPIFNVTLVVIDKNRNEADQRHFHAIAPDSFEGSVQPTDKVDGAYATFTDTAGTRWKRWHSGELDEIPHYPKPDE